MSENVYTPYNELVFNQTNPIVWRTNVDQKVFGAKKADTLTIRVTFVNYKARGLQIEQQFNSFTLFFVYYTNVLCF